jgi:hypothetical protein
LAAVFGLIGSFVVTGYSVNGVSFPAEAAKALLAAGRATISHVGAILFLLVSLALAAVSFLQIKKENE